MECPFTITELNHIVLYVRDLEKSMAFYRMLGIRIEDPKPGRSAFVPLGPKQRLLLHPESDYEQDGHGNLQHFNLIVEGSGKVEDVLDYLRSHGAEPYFEGPENEGRGFVQFRVRDPDGNQVELRAFMQNNSG